MIAIAVNRIGCSSVRGLTRDPLESLLTQNSRVASGLCSGLSVARVDR